MPKNSSELPPPAAFDWRKAWFTHRDCLPHLRQEGAIYFVTYRLADALPASRLEQIRTERDLWLAANPRPRSPEQERMLRRIWTARIERLMDAGHGECAFRRPECRAIAEAVMRHDDGRQYRLGEFVIMPNHVHVLLHVLPNGDLSTILKAWKSISARGINRCLNRKGRLWLQEYFDHIVRDEAALSRVQEYIRRNPCCLPTGTFTYGRGLLQMD